MPKTLRQRAKEDPCLLVTRVEADDILDIEWERGLFPEEMNPLWARLRDEYGLGFRLHRDGITRLYRLNEVEEALQRYDNGETVSRTPPDPEPEEHDDPAYATTDDALVTALEAWEEFPVHRNQNPGEVFRRLGVKSVGFRNGKGGGNLYRFGEVRVAVEAWLRELKAD